MSEETPATEQPPWTKKEAPKKPALSKRKPQKKAAAPKAKVIAPDIDVELDEDEIERQRMRDSLETLKAQRKLKIVISSTETQKEDVKVGVNGHVYQIPRDVECEVPEAVVTALENAKITMYRQQKRADGEEGMEMIPYDVARFPMSIRR